MVYLGLGSNLGDRAGNLGKALAAIAGAPGVALVKASGFHATAPVGGPLVQGEYLNAACSIRTGMEPPALLATLHRIEAALGRDRAAETRRWGPRTIDLDILLWDDRRLSSPTLTIPHPRLAERRFALAPLAMIAPEAVHPVLGRTIAELLERTAPEP